MNGAAGAVIFVDGRATAVMAFTVVAARIVAIDVVADLARVRRLDLSFLDWGVPTWEQINESLRAVVDPELHKDIVTLGMVRSIEQPAPRARGRRRLADHRRLPDRSHFETAVKQSVTALEA